MAIAQAICTAFKKQLLDGDADFDTGGDVFKLALYLSTANLSASATAYTATGESTDTGSGDYTAGGKGLANWKEVSSGIAVGALKLAFEKLYFTFFRPLKILVSKDQVYLAMSTPYLPVAKISYQYYSTY